MTKTAKATAMTADEFNALSDDDFNAMLKKAGGQRGFHRKYGIPRTTVQARQYRARKDPFGHRPPPQPIRMGEDRSIVQRFILTSAQDSTYVHLPFYENLIAYRDWLRDYGTCELLIAGFTYNKSLFEDHSKESSKIFWAPEVEKHYVRNRIRIADRIDFCGEMNTLPTAVQPLSGMESYTQNRWGIFPHAKVQLVSIPTMKHAPTKVNMTTGTITKPNYVPKKAGLKASFHHTYGAVLVEVDTDGDFFCRHLLGDDADGSFYDLDRFISGADVSEGHAARALTPGDIHVFQIDPTVSETTFGFAPTDERDAKGQRVWRTSSRLSMMAELRPDFLFIHDVADFRVRNHHNIGNPLDRFRLYMDGTDAVEDEMREVAAFLAHVDADNPETQTVVVESNHDLAFEKWLNTGDYRADPVNARFFLRSVLKLYDAVAEKTEGFSIFTETMKNNWPELDCTKVRFLREDESFVVDDVEMANHGHNGANGSRGNIRQFARSGPKTTFGHTHTTGIFEGAYNSGTSTLMELGYNKGLSSWTHSHVLQYRDGRRTILTIQNGKYRA